MTIIIITYIANVFLNRWLDKLLVRKFGSEPTPFFWFLSLFATVTLLYAVIEDHKLFDWFTGKHWDKK
jgi:hypothetical protein